MRQYKYVEDLINNYPELITQKENIIQSIELMIDTYKKGNKVLIAGNGGSAADADHIVGELMKGFVKKRKIKQSTLQNISKIDKKLITEFEENIQEPLHTVSLNHPISLISAYSNDKTYDYAIAQNLYGQAREGDLFIGITTSGNSKNIYKAAIIAKAMKVKIIGMTGSTESKLSHLANITIQSPNIETYRIQEFHLPIYHAICLEVENYFFKD